MATRDAGGRPDGETSHTYCHPSRLPRRTRPSLLSSAISSTNTRHPPRAPACEWSPTLDTPVSADPHGYRAQGATPATIDTQGEIELAHYSSLPQGNSRRPRSVRRAVRSTSNSPSTPPPRPSDRHEGDACDSIALSHPPDAAAAVPRPSTSISGCRARPSAPSSPSTLEHGHPPTPRAGPPRSANCRPHDQGRLDRGPSDKAKGPKTRQAARSGAIDEAAKPAMIQRLSALVLNIPRLDLLDPFRHVISSSLALRPHPAW